MTWLAMDACSTTTACDAELAPTGSKFPQTSLKCYQVCLSRPEVSVLTVISGTVSFVRDRWCNVDNYVVHRP